jgi:predicted RNase H-like HicB family nuclease
VIALEQISYRVLVRKEPEGGYTAIVPTLPGCITYGDAIDMAREAIEGYLESLKAHGEEIPTEKDVVEYTVLVKAHA